MDLKELSKELLDEAVGHSPSNDYNPTSTPPKRLTRQSGRQYAYTGPGVTRITRRDKMDLLKEKDINKIMPILENAFQLMIAAVRGTPMEQYTISRLNVLRRQLNKKADQLKKRM